MNPGACVCCIAACFFCACTPFTQSRGVTGSIALERDRHTDTFSPRLGLGYGYHIYEAPLLIPHLANQGAGAGVEVAYAPLTEAVEIAAEVRVISPLLLLLGVGVTTRTGMRWDPNRSGEGFFELAFSFGPWMPDALPSNYCDKTASDPYQSHSYQRCDPATTVTMDDVIDGSGVLYLDSYPIRLWDGGADEALGAQSIETFFAVRGLLSDWVWAR